MRCVLKGMINQHFLKRSLLPVNKFQLSDTDFISGHLLCAPIPAYILYRSFPALTSLIPVRILRLHIGVPVALRHCYILFMGPLFHLFYQTFYLQLYFRFISRLALIFPKFF